MNRNFLPFEITTLLPKENPYQILKIWTLYNLDKLSKNFTWKGDATKPYLLDYSVSLTLSPDIKIRDAWTIIDALTWLELQNYNVNVSCFSNNNKVWYFNFCNPKTSVLIKSYLIGLESFTSRIEAYTAGIEYCLKLINCKNES